MWAVVAIVVVIVVIAWFNFVRYLGCARCPGTYSRREYITRLFRDMAAFLPPPCPFYPSLLSLRFFQASIPKICNMEQMGVESHSYVSTLSLATRLSNFSFVDLESFIILLPPIISLSPLGCNKEMKVKQVSPI